MRGFDVVAWSSVYRVRYVHAVGKVRWRLGKQSFLDLEKGGVCWIERENFTCAGERMNFLVLVSRWRFAWAPGSLS